MLMKEISVNVPSWIIDLLRGITKACYFNVNDYAYSFLCQLLRQLCLVKMFSQTIANRSNVYLNTLSKCYKNQ